jgi:hypothetical protein
MLPMLLLLVVPPPNRTGSLVIDHVDVPADVVLPDASISAPAAPATSPNAPSTVADRYSGRSIRRPTSSDDGDGTS